MNVGNSVISSSVDTAVRSIMTTTYKVSGMTCDHCINAVTNELLAIEGVTAVEVSLESGDVIVTNSREIPLVKIAAAIDEAGYELVLP